MADAWEDDWIQKPDVRWSFQFRKEQPNSVQSKPSTPGNKTPATKLSKAEKRAKQAEFNRQLWEDA